MNFNKKQRTEAANCIGKYGFYLRKVQHYSSEIIPLVCEIISEYPEIVAEYTKVK